MHLLLRWLFSAIALYVTVLVGNALNIQSFSLAPFPKNLEGALVFVLLLGIANAVLRPLLKALTLPLTCLTLGLFSFVINAFLFWLVGQYTPGFHVAGWQAPLFGSVVMSLVGGLLNNLLVSNRERERNRL